MMKVDTLFLIPHAHTDFGYTHDPLITWELHDHFLDRAIKLCESTSDLVENEQFYWTIEVFCTLEHWWNRRDHNSRERLLVLLRSGRIDLGWRFVNGNFLNNPLNIRWEAEKAEKFCREHALPCASAIQNDVNGFALRYARELASRGVRGLAMGINTTMGASPFPRPGAFWWNLGDGERLIVWNGWIYNRIGRWVHLRNLAEGLEEAWPDCVARLPKDYPFSFAMMSGTIGDNVGPFECLPGQVSAFNARKCGLEVRLTTFTKFLDFVAQTPGLPEYEGDWNDAWPFGNGAMPHELTMVRRAQRRLEVVDSASVLLGAGCKANALVDAAQHEISIACEHTYESHTSENDHSLGNDGKRQWVQCQVNFANAESLSMLALRRMLFDFARTQSVREPSVLFVNPTPHEISTRVLWNEKLACQITTSGVLEHLAQFDREPTLEGLARNADVGVPAIRLAPQSVTIVPLEKLSASTDFETLETRDLTGDGIRIGLRENGGLNSLRTTDLKAEWINSRGPWSFGIPVVERPLSSFKFKSEAEKRDPSDAEWNPDLTFHREVIGQTETIEGRKNAYGQEIEVQMKESPVRRIIYRLDNLQPGVLEIEVELRLDDKTDQKALYFPMPFELEGDGPTQFHYDSCGEWIEAPEGQLPGSATSFYESYRGVAVSRGTKCVYVVAPDAPLWQFGGFTFGHPQATLDRESATVMSWLYNNYWYTNFPSAVPSWFNLKYLIAVREGEFDPRVADQLYGQFQRPFFHHPIWPDDI